MKGEKMGESLPPKGWHVDEDSGAWVRDTIHRMGRRCHNWDYAGRGCYQITLTLAERKKALFGRLVGGAQHLGFSAEARGGALGDRALPAEARDGGPRVELSALGAAIEALAWRFGEFTPEIEVLGVMVMPDHLHMVLKVARRLPAKKPLGIAIRGFKGGATKVYWQHLGFLAEARDGALGDRALPAEARDGAVAPGLKSPGPLFSEGFVDTIISDEAALAHELAYLADNPRRLWEKRAHPELFTVMRDLAVDLGDGLIGHFAAIGNHHLLTAANRLQVQCSRRYFAYARDARGALLKAAPPRVESAEFRESAAALLEEAAHGAVLVSPCISEGEREIARRAYEAEARLITLANKGFSPLYKPSGRLFDACAAGRLLMLAPIVWPYLPGEKKMTREDACVLNWLAQRFAGDGAVEIIYKGVTPTRIAELARAAVEEVAA